ncbi:MAG TPA: BON domain-containing protein [Opitutaceae bacterium]|nr:BON domain-containing protein [Opitutaceae bacterium]
MKNAFIFFLLGVIAGVVGLHLYQERQTGSEHIVSSESPAKDRVRNAVEEAADKTKETSANAKDAISRKLEDWHLTSDDIKHDLSESGQVVRAKAKVVGGKIADARIVTVIKAKYVLDKDLSALDIAIDSKDGDITLSGTVASTDLIGKAVALALDTDGVKNVVAKLTVSSK